MQFKNIKSTGAALQLLFSAIEERDNSKIDVAVRGVARALSSDLKGAHDLEVKNPFKLGPGMYYVPMTRLSNRKKYVLEMSVEAYPPANTLVSAVLCERSYEDNGIATEGDNGLVYSIDTMTGYAASPDPKKSLEDFFTRFDKNGFKV